MIAVEDASCRGRLALELHVDPHRAPYQIGPSILKSIIKSQ